MAEKLYETLSNLKLEESVKYDINKTGLTYDPLMLDYYNDWDPLYPEKPDRILKPYERCKFYGLIDKCVQISGRLATPEEIEKKHTKRVVDLMKSSETMSTSELINLSKQYDSMYWHKNVNKAASWALGSSIELMDAILTSRVQNGFAIIRPPGHHAMQDEPNGYCYFNNAAITAQLAKEKYDLKRILIVDWDVHHGQGTQRMFYNDPSVLYFSIHRYDYGNFWPNLRESDFDFIGDEAGKGYNINVPLNKVLKDPDYMAIFNEILLPIAYEFNPELVIISSGYDSCIGCFEFDPQFVVISCGFDSAIGDEKGRMNVTPSCYTHFINSLSCLANGKLCVLLEGGYCIKSLSEGVALTLRGLLGYPCPRLDDFTEADPMIVDMISNLKAVLRPYWCSLQYLNENDSINLCEFLAKFDEKRKEIKFFTEETRPKEFELSGFYPLYADEENERLDKMIDGFIETTDLYVPSKRTCLAYSYEMMKHHFLNNKNHPEQPARIKRIIDELKSAQLYSRCGILKTRHATDKEIQLVHSRELIESLKQLSTKTEEELVAMNGSSKDSLYYHWDTYECASLATGCLLQVVDAVCTREYSNGVAIVRPPGHHAFANRASGFCFFNNIAVATRYAQEKYHKKRVLILDWDVHHGNGTQDIFKDDKSVLFVSLHRYDGGSFYPLQAASNSEYVGEGNAKGYTVNIPWNTTSMRDQEYITAFLHVIMPIAYQFNPDLVLISAGLDAALGDPLGGYKITPTGFAQMLKMLMSLANGNVILALEGGYNLTAISVSMSACVSTLLGDPVPSFNASLIPKEVACQTLRECIQIQKKYWSCLKFDSKLPQVDFVKRINLKKEKPENTVKSEYSLRSRKINSASNMKSQEEQQKQVSQLADELNQVLTMGHAVLPLASCPHQTSINALKQDINVHTPCVDCKTIKENWFCLVCHNVYCSRYVSSHMLEHFNQTGHALVLSFSDLSVWCYFCDAYIRNAVFNEFIESASTSKFSI